MRAYIVLDLGFGDAGKGILTDFLARHFKAGVVVRYNGGAQAGHNVVSPDGRHHTFSQFGSGTFIPGVKTFLSRHVVVHPTALLVEGEALRTAGVQDAFSRIKISDQALIITPFHQAANHIREIARGKDRHGSCGVGVGETVEDALSNREESILTGDLSNPRALRRKLLAVREHKREQLLPLCQDHLSEEAFAREWELFERADVIDTWMLTISRIADLRLVAADSMLENWLHETETVIFEGAQGVLLDEDFGFHPYTTWSNCTAEHAHNLINEMAPGSSAYRVGVLRSHAVRHGPGPLPTETSALTTVVTDHNQHNDWQGQVRYGWFDAVLARYALNVTGGVDALFVTHLDVLPRVGTWRYCSGYRGQFDFDRASIDLERSRGAVFNFLLPRSLPLAQREQFTQALFKADPVLEPCDPDEGKVIQKIQTLLGRSVNMISEGPAAENVRIINTIPS